MDRSSDRRVLYKSRKTLKNKDFVEWVTAQRSISKPLTSAYYYVFIARCSQNRREIKGVTNGRTLFWWSEIERREEIGREGWKEEVKKSEDSVKQQEVVFCSSSTRDLDSFFHGKLLHCKSNPHFEKKKSLRIYTLKCFPVC